ncbi:MAG: acyltransferase, partial [Patescibacteria group bacterium]|nr:acyltransferase [Patescibacteria group bacterium]
MGIIRLLLAIFVVIHHSYPPFGYIHLNATLAVQAFFVISGFYMTLILKEKYINKNGSYFLFISNRFLRIYPTYWLILLITIGLSYFWFYSGQQSEFGYYQQFYHYSKNSLFLYANPLDILRDITLLFRFDYLQLNDDLHQYLLLGQAWTLVVELLFYAIAPFIVKRIRIIIPLFFISLGLHYL